MEKNKILVIGKVPPPIGGVSIHISRLLDHLDDKQVSYYFYDLKNFSLLKFVNLVRKFKISHLHTNSYLLQVIYSLISFFSGNKSIITYHCDLVGNITFLQDILLKISLKFVNVPIVLNQHSYKKAYRINKKTKLIGSFFPPARTAQLDEKVKKELDEFRKKYNYIFSTNAYRRVFDNNRKEIYGISYILEAIKNLPNCGLIFADPSGEHERFVSHSNLNIYYIKGAHSFFNIIEYSDCLIRYTSTDGDAVSIREALFLKKTVIATDVVSRPEGVVLCKYNQEQNLVEVMQAVSNNLYKKTISVSVSNFGRILDLYN